jgi:hypothetical protein
VWFLLVFLFLDDDTLINDDVGGCKKLLYWFGCLMMLSVRKCVIEFLVFVVSVVGLLKSFVCDVVVARFYNLLLMW